MNRDMTKIVAWIKALESGEYTQCQYQLYDGTGYCCLGVYADIHGIEYRNCGPDDDEPNLNGGAYSIIRGQVKPSIFRHGVEMNDKGFHFLSIAAMIREEYKL